MSDVTRKSIWKKELKLKRTPKPDAVESTPVQAPDAPRAASTSLWKKELKLKRAPKEAKAGRVPLLGTIVTSSLHVVYSPMV